MQRIVDRVSASLYLDSNDSDSMALAHEAATTVSLMAYAYCRGNGFTIGTTGDVETSNPELEAVIVSATTRYAANPTGLEYRAGTETVSGAFSGWTLAEQAVLNNYRKRWA